MKRVFMVIAAAVVLASCNSNRCEIVGAIDNFEAEGYVYLLDMWEEQAVIDSVLVEKDRFHFKRVKHEPTFAILTLSGGRPISYLFLEGGKVYVAGDVELGDMKAQGTPSNDAFNDMMASSQTYMNDYRAAGEAGDKAAMAKIEQEFNAMQQEYLANNSANVFGLFLLNQQSYSEPSSVILKLLEGISDEMKALPMAQRIKSRAESKFKTEPQVEGSDYVPYYIDIELPNVAGEVVSLKSVVEKSGNRYVLLDFWASWCGPCMREMPVLREAYKLYHKRGFEIYGVSLDENEKSWKEAIEKQQMKWLNHSPLAGFATPSVDDYAVESIPTNYLIDCSNGVIIAKNLRGEEVLEKLAELYK